MWDLPGLGLEPVFPELAGGFLTTVPPGKSHGAGFEGERVETYVIYALKPLIATDQSQPYVQYRIKPQNTKAQKSAVYTGPPSASQKGFIWPQGQAFSIVNHATSSWSNLPMESAIIRATE